MLSSVILDQLFCSGVGQCFFLALFSIRHYAERLDSAIQRHSRSGLCSDWYADLQVLAIWDWTIDGETPICSADLQPSFGVQNYIQFNTEDIHHLVTNSDHQVLFFTWVRSLSAVCLLVFYKPPTNKQSLFPSVLKGV